jgi:hypothetical protein
LIQRNGKTEYIEYDSYIYVISNDTAEKATTKKSGIKDLNDTIFLFLNKHMNPETLLLKYRELQKELADWFYEYYYEEKPEG